MRSPQGEHNPAGSEGMAEAKSRGEREGNGGASIPRMRGMRSPQGEHNPAGAEGMPEAKSRSPLKLLPPQPLSHEPVVDNISIVTFIYQFPFNKFLY